MSTTPDHRQQHTGSGAGGGAAPGPELATGMTGTPCGPVPGAAPQRTEFATTDPDEALAFLDTLYTARPARAGALDRSSPLSISQIRAGEISAVDLTLPPELALHLDGTDTLSVSTVVAGATEAELGKTVERYRAGQVCLGAFPHGDYEVRCTGLRVAIMTVPAGAIARAAGALPDQPLPDQLLPGQGVEPLRFASLAAASPGAGEQWKRAAAFVRGVLDDDQTAASPLILGSAARLLAATALAVFPNNLLTGQGPTGHPHETRAAPDTVRRAEEFIHAHAHTDLDVTDIAAAAGVTPRALQYAFARHHDTTPMRYLRRVRLDHAHQDLLVADPGGGVTVTAVAARWGFAHPGRFAAAYRRAYGSSPGTTLRT